MTCIADRMTDIELGDELRKMAADRETSWESSAGEVRNLFEDVRKTDLDNVRREVALTAQVVLAYSAVYEHVTRLHLRTDDIDKEVDKLKWLRSRQAELEAQFAGKVTP